jgi:hypothetical protein
LNVTLYFRDSAGVIIVVAAAFSLGKMVRTNELVAMIASGVSAKRIVRPILVLAIFFTALSVADQELLIPSISDSSRGTPTGQAPRPSHRGRQWLLDLLLRLRRRSRRSTVPRSSRVVDPRPGSGKSGRISRPRVYNDDGRWDLINGG